MRTLSLLRHAKSDWESVDLSDVARPLNRRGRKAAPMMGKFMAAHNLLPDIVLCSNAARTCETLDLLLPALECKPKIKYEDELYLAGAGTMLARLKAVKAKHQHVLMIGHNPGIHRLALGLCGGGAPDARFNLAQKFPTAALAVFSFEAKSWVQINQGDGHLDLYMVPKAL